MPAAAGMTKFYLVCMLLCLLLGLSACGYRPLYGEMAQDKNTAAELNSVAINNIKDREGQMLRNMLIDRMYVKGRPANPQYTLDIGISSGETELGIRKDATAARAQLTMTANILLRDKTGKELLRTNTASFVSYNRLDAQYATLTARENAHDRALRDISEKIVNRLSLYFGTEHKPVTATQKSPPVPMVRHREPALPPP